jgi:hypothetical protein
LNTSEGMTSPAMKSPRPHTPAGIFSGAADAASGRPARSLASTSTNPESAFVAAGVSERLQQIGAVLAPVIGHGGVVALYERSRHLSSRTYPWLAPPTEGFRSGMDLEDLKSLVARQDDDAAAAGAGLLLKSFHDLLAGLVGESLTIQLLGAPPSLGPATDWTP